MAGVQSQPRGQFRKLGVIAMDILETVSKCTVDVRCFLSNVLLIQCSSFQTNDGGVKLAHMDHIHVTS